MLQNLIDAKLFLNMSHKVYKVVFGYKQNVSAIALRLRFYISLLHNKYFAFKRFCNINKNVRRKNKELRIFM